MSEMPAAWLRLIAFVESECPHGEITIRIVDKLPQKLVGVKREIRFDKNAYFPKPGEVKGKGFEVKSEEA